MSESIVGLNLNGSKICLVDIEHFNSRFQVNTAILREMPVTFSFSAVEDFNSLSALVESINNVVRDHDLESRKTVLSLDNVLVFIKKIPIDGGFTDTEVAEQVLWENEQFILSPREDYYCGHQRLLPTAKSARPEVLIVTVRKKVIDFLREVFQRTSLDLRWIEVDVFAAQKAIEANYDIGEKDNIALVDVGRKGLVFTLLVEKEFFLVHNLPVAEQDSDSGEHPFTSTESIAKLISKELRRLILDNRLGKNIEDLNWVFLYGERAEEEIAMSLQSIYATSIEIANPFRRLDISPSANVNQQYLDQPGEFLISVGSGLRRV